MSLLGVPCEYMQLHTCLRLWSICALSVEVVKCKIPSWYLSACSLTRNGHSYPFFKGDIVSDYSLNLKPTYQAFQGRSKEPICTWTPFRSHQVSSIILFKRVKSDLTMISETNSLVCFHSSAPLHTVLSWQPLIILRGAEGLSSWSR